MTISPDVIDAFGSDGAVLLRGVFPDWVDPLRRGIERNLREPGPYQRIYTPSGGAGRFVGDYCNWSRTGVAYDHKTDQLEDMPDIDAHRADYRLLSWDLEPGDAIAFHFLTVHGAPGNLSVNRRRAFASRWLGDDAVYAVRHGETSPPFPGLEQRLKPGDPLAAEEFPLVAA